jgi:LacI family transcriptional regulator
MTPVSLSDIARVTGFAVSTVSRALGDSPKISVGTQKRIKDVAQRLNYRPKPILASLARKHFNSGEDKGVPLAFFHLPVPPEDEPLVRKVIKANQDYASKLGYNLEPFLVPDFKDGAQATRVLFSRGFQGIILSADFRFDLLPGMDWSRFSIVGCGEILMDPPAPYSRSVNHAAVDQFRSVLTAWNETRKRGYRRIGFALFKICTTFVHDQIRWRAAHACLRNMPTRDRIPTFVLRNEVNSLSSAEFAQWVRLHRPDAIIDFNGYMRWALKHEGFRVPQDIAFASLHRETGSDLLQLREDSESRMKNPRLETSFAAIELLDQQIRHYQYGLLLKPRIQFIQSEWIDGDSMPPKAKAPAGKDSRSKRSRGK